MQAVRVAVGILKRDCKVLISQRPLNKAYGGFWEFPGGKLEPAETAKSALTRELKEELDIEVISAKSWFIHEHTYIEKKVLLEMWIVEDFIGEPKGNENQIIRWVNYTELKQLPVLEGNKFILEKLQEIISI